MIRLQVPFQQLVPFQERGDSLHTERVRGPVRLFLLHSMPAPFFLESLPPIPAPRQQWACACPMAYVSHMRAGTSYTWRA